MYKKIKLVVCILIMLFMAHSVSAFKPTAENGHAGMIRKGMIPVTYVLSDGTVLKFSDRAILEVRAGNEHVDEYFSGELSIPMAHFDNELLNEGSKRLKDLKDTIINHLISDPPNGAAARRDLGRALHTLQDFYAHSNWAHNPGPANTTFCSTLGRGLLTNLPSTVQTCVEDFWLGTLTGRGLIDLTSGYCPSTPTGKCAHGLVLGAGIHQDTPARPFYIIAENCAIAGTTDYIRQIITDHRITSDETAMRAFFDAKGSLGFVIDDTGSMGTEISGVKTAVTRIINKVKDDPSLKPDHYVLVTFGDPNVGTPTITSDASTLLSRVNAIYVSGGGDCPELAMAGLMRAIDASSQGGILYLFTDASAKDASLVWNVVAKAQAKKITINALLTGSCSPIDEAYKKVCSETGGQWLIVRKRADAVADYFNMVEPELTGDFQTLLIADGTLDESITEFSLPVDSTMTSLLVSVNIGSDPYNSQPGAVILNRPNGSQVNDGDPNVVYTNLLNGVAITITEPVVGDWTLQISGNAGLAYSASAKGNSPISFERFYFAEYQDHRPMEGSFFPMTGQPIMGQEQTSIANITGLFQTAAFELVSKTGKKLMSINMVKGHEEVAAEDFLGTFRLPTESFRVLATGTDEYGNNYMRIFPTVFLGQGVQVNVADVDAEMIAGNRFTAGFTITNIGTTDTFSISAADSYGYVRSVTPAAVNLDTGTSADIEVTLDIPGDAPTATTILTVVAQSATDENIRNSALLSRDIQGDTDGDGVSDVMEKGTTGTDADYDGNNDGQADYLQQNVGSLYTQGTGHYVTLAVTGSGNFKNLKAVSNPSETNAPSGASFPYGFFSFEIGALTPGESTTVEINLSSSVNQYYLYGPTASNPDNAWYAFASDGTTGATFNGNSVILTVKDGARGDNDLDANAVISIIGGPAEVESATPPDNSESDSGGCFISTALESYLH